MNIKVTLLSNYRTYGIELRERNYPQFEGKYNDYISVYGQLSGQYMGCIEEHFKINITENQAPEFTKDIEQFIQDNKYRPVSIW